MNDHARHPEESRAARAADGPALLDIVGSLDVGVVVVDARLVVRFRNPAAARLPDAPELSGVFHGARFLGPFDGWEAEIRRVLDSGEPRRLECVAPLAADRSTTLFDLHCTALAPRAGRSPDCVVILVDERPVAQDLDRQVEISKRLTSLGKLATRVAHELNNPLDGILRYVNLAIRTIGETPDAKLQSYLTESRTGLMRMVHIISDLLEFSRSSDGEFDESDINEIVEQAMRSHGEAARAAGVIIAADFQNPQMPAIRGGRLYQVCANLVRNAIDAMPNGGRLSIATGTDDDQVVIRVADNGAGLPDDIERVFEPFYTTKAPGKGSGLGLAICREFVEDLGGTITAERAPGGGAAFIVRIPLTACRSSRRLDAGDRASSQRGSVGHAVEASLSPDGKGGRDG